MTSPGFPTVIMLALVAVAWSRRGSVPRSEVLAVLSLLMFSWSAWRNMTPALLLLAPVVAESLCLAFPHVARRPEPRWSKPTGVGLAVSLTALGLLSIPGREFLPVQQNPVDLAKRIAQLEPHLRVLNDYNVAGLALYFGGADTQVAIDGRADRYGADYIESYLKLTISKALEDPPGRVGDLRLDQARYRPRAIPLRDPALDGGRHGWGVPAPQGARTVTSPGSATHEPPCNR